MNHPISFILKTIQSTFVGLIVLIVLLGIGLLTLEPIIDLLYPPLPLCPPAPEDAVGPSEFPCYSPMLGSIKQNSGKYLSGLFVHYFVSISIAGFITGAYVNNLRLRAKADHKVAYVGQSLISGLIVGSGVPILIAVISNRPNSIDDVFEAFIHSSPAIITAFIGYTFHYYKHRLNIFKM